MLIQSSLALWFLATGEPGLRVHDQFLDSVAVVESSHRSWVIGDHGRAVGLMQIHPSVIDDVNLRFLAKGQRPYTLADRLDPVKSKEIFTRYTRGWISIKGLPKGMTVEEAAARTWNGGPNGPMKAATLVYWDRVKAAGKRRV